MKSQIDILKGKLLEGTVRFNNHQPVIEVDLADLKSLLDISDSLQEQTRQYLCLLEQVRKKCHEYKAVLETYEDTMLLMQNIINNPELSVKIDEVLQHNSCRMNRKVLDYSKYN